MVKVKKLYDPEGDVIGGLEKDVSCIDGDIDDIETKKPIGDKKYSDRLKDVREKYGEDVALEVEDAAEQRLLESVSNIRRNLRKRLMRLGCLAVVGVITAGGCYFAYHRATRPPVESAEKALDAKIKEVKKLKKKFLEDYLRNQKK